ncbi:MAG: MBL fold metallo-hydrolase [Proteobacteria bacterium]|nr:MBL fold metallo-hydrolase [Pseudomonadota bacterium]
MSQSKKKGKRRVWTVPSIVLVVLFLGAAGLFLAAGNQLGGSAKGERLERMRASPNFKNGRAQNPVPTDNSWGLVKIWETIKDYRGGRQTVPDQPPPIMRLSKGSFSARPASGLRVTWLGHSSVLVEIDGQVILFDPVFADRASPFSFLGPRRFHPAPISIEDLPPLNAVVISHDHYDHLDYEAVVELAPKTQRFFVPLGVGAHLEAWDVPALKIAELDWWEEKESGGIKFAACPARHFSGRSVSADKTLWASWTVAGPGHRVFFSGDTGAMGLFEKVGELYGPFDLTLIKIGAYGRTWPDIHIDPREGIILNRMVRGRLMMPVHWGTFNLSYHGWTEPAERLIDEADRTDTSIVIPRVGQMFEPASPPALDRWWPVAPWRRSRS